MLPREMKKLQHPSAPSDTQKGTRRCRQIAVDKGNIGGPDRDRTDDLFHAIHNEAFRGSKGTYRALRSRKSAPIVPSFSIHLSR
jgi:hypothetical protein